MKKPVTCHYCSHCQRKERIRYESNVTHLYNKNVFHFQIKKILHLFFLKCCFSSIVLGIIYLLSIWHAWDHNYETRANLTCTKSWSINWMCSELRVCVQKYAEYMSILWTPSDAVMTERKNLPRACQPKDSRHISSLSKVILELLGDLRMDFDPDTKRSFAISAMENLLAPPDPFSVVFLVCCPKCWMLFSAKRASIFSYHAVGTQ